MITRTHYYRPGQGAKKKSVGSLTLPDLSGDEFAFIDWIESYGAALASVTTGLIIYYVLHRHIYVLSVNSQFTALFGAVVSVFAISVGFLGTVAAVLFAIDSRRVVRRLRKINTYQQFMGYVVKAIWWCFGCTVVTTVLILFGDVGVPSFCHFLVLSFWSSLCAMSGLTCLRAVLLFTIIVQEAADEP